MAVLFVSETYIKNNSLIDENVDVRLILPSIRDALELRIHPILGTPFYEDLKNKITAGTLNADEVSFLQKELHGVGGFQSLIASLQTKLHGHDLELNLDDVERI